MVSLLVRCRRVPGVLLVRCCSPYNTAPPPSPLILDVVPEPPPSHTPPPLRTNTQVVAAAANCPSGSDYYVNNSWPGLKPGCDCEDTTNDNFTTQYDRLCTSNEKSANCDDLPGTPEVELYNFNGYKVGWQRCVCCGWREW